MPQRPGQANPLVARAIRPDEYDAWYQTVTDEYAADIARNGLTAPEIASRKAVQDMATVLPAGLETPGQAILILEVAGQAIGRLWVGERSIDGRSLLYVWDVEIDPTQRGKGYGRAAMLLAEEEARRRGLARVELNVFGGNEVARRLYRSLGYVERAVSMAKDLGDSIVSR